MIDRSTILDLWLALLETVTNAYKSRNETDIKKESNKSSLWEKEVVLGAEALTIVGEIGEYAKLNSKKKSVFNIVQGIRNNNKSFISKVIYDDDNYIIGDAEIYTIEELIAVLDVIDGVVDCILVDSDIKSTVSKEFLDCIYRNIRKSKIYSYSDIEVCCKSVSLLIQYEFSNMEDAVVCLFPINNHTKYLAGMLGNKIAKVIFYDGSKESQDLDNVDLFISFSFGEELMNEMIIRKLPQNTLMIDATTEAIDENGYDIIHENNIKALRPERRPLLSSQMFLLEQFEQYMKSARGHFMSEGYHFTSGGIIGKKGDIIVDSIRNPKKIVGIADGKGRIILSNKLKKKDLEKIQKATEILKI